MYKVTVDAVGDELGGHFLSKDDIDDVFSIPMTGISQEALYSIIVLPCPKNVIALQIG